MVKFYFKAKSLNPNTSSGMSAKCAALKPWLFGQAPSSNLYKNVISSFSLSGSFSTKHFCKYYQTLKHVKTKDRHILITYHVSKADLFVVFEFLDQVVIMRWKEGKTLDIVCQLFDDTVSDRYTIVCGGSTSKFINKNKWMRCCIMENTRCFTEFQEKCTLAMQDLITRADSCKNAVDWSKFAFFSWYITALSNSQVRK